MTDKQDKKDTGYLYEEFEIPNDNDLLNLIALIAMELGRSQYRIDRNKWYELKLKFTATGAKVHRGRYQDVGMTDFSINIVREKNDKKNK